MRWIGWKPLELDWVKLNTNGSLLSTIGMPSARGVFRDNNRGWLGGFFGNIGPGLVDNVEAL